jgi:hypothetical protein
MWLEKSGAVDFEEAGTAVCLKKTEVRMLTRRNGQPDIFGFAISP